MQNESLELGNLVGVGQRWMSRGEAETGNRVENDAWKCSYLQEKTRMARSSESIGTLQ